VDFEGELALVIGRRARRVPKDAWREFVAGVTCAVDVSARDLQKSDGQWWRAKGFDTFCPLGPALETDVDPGDLLLETLVDGAVKQSARTSAMTFDAGTLVAWASSAMTLEPGDVILTGTPEGVAPLAAGQRVEVRIERVGSLVVTVEKEPAARPLL
jgi:2-keto-4-pentenoate hydratase/2-oxohepta-3-ene-1,7-dioic acid hydratase in catechol pathway